jgi:hypothetical protein
VTVQSLYTALKHYVSKLWIKNETS